MSVCGTSNLTDLLPYYCDKQLNKYTLQIFNKSISFTKKKKCYYRVQ